MKNANQLIFIEYIFQTFVLETYLSLICLNMRRGSLHYESWSQLQPLQLYRITFNIETKRHSIFRDFQTKKNNQIIKRLSKSNGTTFNLIVLGLTNRMSLNWLMLLPK